MHSWKLQEAKARFSEVVKICKNDGPQMITVHGKEEAVIISKEDFEKMCLTKQDIVSFIQSSPLNGLSIDTNRNKSLTRSVDL